MAINTSLLIAAPMLQDYFVDKDTGEALAAGIISFYHDNARTIFKNVYYQSGTPGNYTYITLPNPLTLSGVGTIQDGNGNDVIPFFYPYDETDNSTPDPYYITVDSSDFQRQFTRANFPFVASQPTATDVPTLDNIVSNNVFWRNVGSINVTNETNIVISPGAHDGYSLPDIRFIKDITGANDTITFNKFPLGSPPGQVLPGDITPEYYLNFQCTAPQLGEILKVINIPISLHVETLESVPASISIYMQNVAGNANNQITLYIYQFLGTGVVSPNPIPIQTIPLTNNWQRYVIPFIFPSASGATLGDGGDDALYLQIGIPLGVVCNFNIAKPSIYLSNEVPTNEFTTYDEVDTIINSPRTGDIRTSLNAFWPYGWVLMNDGTIGSALSNATTRANQDTWQLFNLIWNQLVTFQALAPMFTSAGAPVSYGSNAIDDFSANNQISLTRTLGRVIAGTTPTQTNQTFTASGNILTVASTAQFFTGVPIVFITTGTLPSPLQANVVYYSIQLSLTTMSVATTPENAIAGSAITLTTTGTGTNTVITPVYIPGVFLGEETHTQTIAEMPSHNHPGSTATMELFGTPTAGTNDAYTNRAGASPQPIVTVAAQGGGQPFTIVQPTVYYNIYMKL